MMTMHKTLPQMGELESMCQGKMEKEDSLELRN